MKSTLPLILWAGFALWSTASANEDVVEPVAVSIDLTDLAQRDRCMPGEFEMQDYLLLGCGPLTDTYASTMVEIAVAVRDRVHVVLLYADRDQRKALSEALFNETNSTHNVSLMTVSHDSKWVRDYGPTVIRSGSDYRMVDWLYETGRPQDELVPQQVAALSRTPWETASIVLHGGNLLSNGSGLCLTSFNVFSDNRQFGINRRDLQKQLGNRIGANNVVVLETLMEEPTGHLDIFATFTDANTVVVGQFSAEEDPDNSEILDNNAAILAKVVTPNGPLRVERIPMGVKSDGLFRTYTNCIYANGILIVPTYRGFDAQRLEQAIACYQRLLPKWKVVCVDASEIIQEAGALHCISLNIPRIDLTRKSITLPLEIPQRPADFEE